MGLVTITSKGQMTLPKQIRDELQIQPGDQCYVWVRGGDIVVMPKNKSFKDLAGLLGKPPRGAGSTLEEIDEAVGQAVARHVLGLDEEEE
jgi:antitoxin PrlF